MKSIIILFSLVVLSFGLFESINGAPVDAEAVEDAPAPEQAAPALLLGLPLPLGGGEGGGPGAGVGNLVGTLTAPVTGLGLTGGLGLGK